MTIENYIKKLYSNNFMLQEYLESVVKNHTVLNVPIPKCFYLPEFSRWYDTYKEEIELYCKQHSYEDKRKNDIMKQRKSQFVYWNVCKKLLEELV